MYALFQLVFVGNTCTLIWIHGKFPPIRHCKFVAQSVKPYEYGPQEKTQFHEEYKLPHTANISIEFEYAIEW